jgi:F-type H+-transporting ATPase subunit gamma
MQCLCDVPLQKLILMSNCISFRQYPSNILMLFNDFGKRPPQFGDAIKVANAILESGYEFEEGILIYNRFK